MKSLNILLLEDDAGDSQRIFEFLSEDYTITLATNLNRAKEVLTSSHFDFAILDISINGKLEGVEFAKFIQSTSSPVPFLFLTSMQSKTVFDQAKLTMPFTYLIKPFNVFELKYSIELAIEKHYQEGNTLRSNTPLLTPNYLLIKNQNKICKVVHDTIEYIEVEENYSTLHTADKRYVVKKSLSKIKDLLSGKSFEQIHRKFVINFDKIKEINLSENTIYLDSGFQVSISERYKKQFTSRYDIIK